MKIESTPLIGSLVAIGLLVIALPLGVYFQTADRSQRHVRAVWLAAGGSGEMPDFDRLNTPPPPDQAGDNTSQNLQDLVAEKQKNVPAESETSLANLGTESTLGNPDAGRRIFFENEQASCSKCHRVGEQGGVIGPDLSKIGEKSYDENLESILEPSKKITEGYATLIVATLDGQIVAGILRENSDERLVLVDADGKETIILQEDVDETQPGLSAMPATYRESLTPQQLQDLMAYLMSLKDK